MSRTYRDISYFHGVRVWVSKFYLWEDEYYVRFYEAGHFVNVNKYGWRWVENNATTEEYNHSRKLRGDCATKYYLNGSLPRRYRKQGTKTLRQTARRELQKYISNADHEVVLNNFDGRNYGYW